jgi:hypothetical protein
MWHVRIDVAASGHEFDPEFVTGFVIDEAANNG